MKLNPEQIAKIEEVLTEIECGKTHGEIADRYKFHPAGFSAFMVVLRRIGVVPTRERKKHLRLTSSEHAEFLEWQRQREADQ